MLILVRKKALHSGFGFRSHGQVTTDGLNEAAEWYKRALSLYTTRFDAAYHRSKHYATQGEDLNASLKGSERLHEHPQHVFLEQEVNRKQSVRRAFGEYAKRMKG